ncbi:hypothetical protein SDC9_197417 [bioreactor metagenome]|uniref:Uncharacterized protein n=1 Tax=bioreactor metagenome TaxID=1076179 RepID=A0A645IEU5_9ZZZZ
MAGMGDSTETVLKETLVEGPSLLYGDSIHRAQAPRLPFYLLEMRYFCQPRNCGCL